MKRTLEKSHLETHSFLTLPPVEHFVLLGGISPRVKLQNLYAGHHIRLKYERHCKSNSTCVFMVCISVLSTLYGTT